MTTEIKSTIAEIVSSDKRHMPSIDDFIKSSTSDGVHALPEVLDFLMYKAYEEFNEAAKLITEAYSKIDWIISTNAKASMTETHALEFVDHLVEIVSTAANAIVVYQNDSDAIESVESVEVVDEN